jgi:hypothetical protein
MVKEVDMYKRKTYTYKKDFPEELQKYIKRWHQTAARSFVDCSLDNLCFDTKKSVAKVYVMMQVYKQLCMDEEYEKYRAMLRYMVNNIKEKQNLIIIPVAELSPLHTCRI